MISILLTGFPFGFAQTPVNPRNLRGRHGDAVVAAAGPISNLVVAAVFAIPLRILLADPSLGGDPRTPVQDIPLSWDLLSYWC